MVKPAKYEELHTVLSDLKQELDEAANRSSEPEEAIPQEAAAVHDHPAIQRIVAYAETDYAAATLDRAAQIVHMNASYVSSLFRKVTGDNFSDYVHAIRMKKAAELLQTRRWTATEVSEMVGYANAKNFIRAFKQYYGKTPGQFKHGH